MPGIFKLRRGRGPIDLAVDMAGVRLGERVLQAGVADPRVFARLAGKAGLTGRACVVVDSVEASRLVEAAAEREGVLVEVAVADSGHWPYEDSSFDVGLLDGNALLGADAAARRGRIDDMKRVVRPGGRVIVLRSWPMGLAGRLGLTGERAQHREGTNTLLEALQAAGFRPVRLLTEREGFTFVEGFRPTH